MSPAWISVTSNWFFPLRRNNPPSFSVLSFVELKTSVSFVIFPETTLNRVNFPTNGSTIVLKTTAENGSLTSTFLMISWSSLVPLKVPTSAGDGIYFWIISRRKSVPIVFSAEPTTSGARSPAAIDAFIPFSTSSGVNSSPSKYFSISSSSDSAIFSIRLSLISSIADCISAGTGISFLVLPLYSYAFPSITLTRPLKSADNPIGNAKGIIFSPSSDFSSSSNFSKLIFSLSILFTKTILGVEYFSRFFHAFSVPTSIPEDTSTKSTEPSLALLAPYISPTKSKYPGVSSRLNL